MTNTDPLAGFRALGDMLLNTHWYRNGTRGAFHLEAPDWVRSGKAVCGAKIKNPGFAITSPMLGQTTLCLRCLAKHYGGSHGS